MSEAQKQGNKNNLFIALIVILVLLNCLQLYLNHRDNQKNQELIENKEMELVSTYAKLDSISSQLDNKIEELRAMNENVDSLLLIQQELEQDKQDLKKAGALAQNRYAQIKDKVEGYETLLKRKDAEIAQLREVNQELLDQTITLKNEKNDLRNEISTLNEQRQVMTKKIDRASQLRAVNMTFEQVSRSGKAKEGSEFREKKVAKINIKFNIDYNAISLIGAKSVILRLVDPEGAVLYNVASGSGTFIANGAEMFYTQKQEVVFDNTRQQVAFTYTKESDLKKGRYTAEIYGADYKMGESSFIIK